MKTLLSILIVCLSLLFTGKSQTFTTENNKLCLDSLAARLVLGTIYENNSLKWENSILREYVTKSDSIIENNKKIQDGMSFQLQCKTDSLAAWQNRYYIDMNKAVRERRTLWWYVRGGMVLSFLIAVFK